MDMKRNLICLTFSIILILPLLSISVKANQPPDAPIITGPTSGKVGKAYEYNFSAVDPDSHDVYFWIEWEPACTGCKWVGPYKSGEIAKINYSWSSRGTYVIRAAAKDIHDEEGPTGTLQVIMTRNKNDKLLLLNQLFALFPAAFPILRILMDRYN
jgi:hypothetical protein